MLLKIKYVHTNIVAKNWEKLADFYIEVFGCSVVPPVRNYKGKDLESAVNIKNVTLNGVHLRLPDYNKTGPTLEIFSYTPPLKKQNRKVNTPGITHLAFEVSDVKLAYKKVIANGGKKVVPATLEETMIQVASHSTYHRCQINTRFRELGGNPAMVDFVAWVWLGKPNMGWDFI
jgi:predicted enzyme related to lactoylglutathione lyase